MTNTHYHNRTRCLLVFLLFIRTVVYFCLVLFGTGYLISTARPADPEQLFIESGRVEVTQNILLIFVFLMSVILAFKSLRGKPLGIGLAGFILVLLIREQNNWFMENLGYGYIEALAGLVVIVTLVVLFFFRGQFLDSIWMLYRSPAFGWVSSGVAAVLFAQHLDESALWEYLLGPDFTFFMKRAGEETVELLGYQLFTIGIFEYGAYRFLEYQIETKTLVDDASE